MKKSRTTLKEIKPEHIIWKSITYNPLSKEVEKSFKNHSQIKISYKTQNKLRSILGNPKDKIKTENKSGIHKTNCDNCEKVYVKPEKNE